MSRKCCRGSKGNGIGDSDRRQPPSTRTTPPCPNTRSHVDVLTVLLADRRVTSRLVADAHLAALAIEHGITLCSTDGDFARFPSLRWQNPLAAA